MLADEGLVTVATDEDRKIYFLQAEDEADMMSWVKAIRNERKVGLIDFELYAEARISDTGNRRGNSGIYFRCAPHVDKKQEFPPGYEAQLDHGDRNNPTGSIYALKVKGARALGFATKDGEWVTMRIRAVGNHLRTWVNGKPAADCRDPENRHKKGSILLQMHHLTGKVEFREVRIRKIAKK